MEGRKKMHWFRAYRLAEVMLMSGFFIIGSFFAIDNWQPDILFRLPALCLISFFTILSIYTYNSAAGKSVDEYNIRLESLRQYSARKYIITGSVFLTVALGISFYISLWFPLLTLLIFFIWVFYSHPKFGLKHKAYWGTVLHFFAQIIHFNAFYMAFKPIDAYSISLSVYFALAFASGHLNHEIIDYDADLKAGVKNTATRKGVRFVSITLLIICLVNILFVMALLNWGPIDRYTALLLFIPLVVQLLIYQFYFNRLKKLAKHIRAIYRAAYFISFLLLILLRIFEVIP